MNKRGVFKLAELERELGVSRCTLYKWLRSGRLRSFGLQSGHSRIPLGELHKFMLQKTPAEKYSPYDGSRGESSG